jgi:hypothetical protein
MADYVSRFPKRFPSRWEVLMEFKRQKAGLYTPAELKIIQKRIKEKRKDIEKEKVE